MPKNKNWKFLTSDSFCLIASHIPQLCSHIPFSREIYWIFTHPLFVNMKDKLWYIYICISIWNLWTGKTTVIFLEMLSIFIQVILVSAIFYYCIKSHFTDESRQQSPIWVRVIRSHQATWGAHIRITARAGCRARQGHYHAGADRSTGWSHSSTGT